MHVSQISCALVTVTNMANDICRYLHSAMPLASGNRAVGPILSSLATALNLLFLRVELGYLSLHNVGFVLLRIRVAELQDFIDALLHRLGGCLDIAIEDGIGAIIVGRYLGHHFDEGRIILKPG